MRVLDSLFGRSRHTTRYVLRALPSVERLEERETPTATPTIMGTILAISGGWQP